MDIKSVLKLLTEKTGVSGDETDAAAAAEELLRQYTDDVRTDALGNVIGLIKAEGAEETIMLDAHIDRVGLIVTYIDEDGFLKVGGVGAPDMRVSPAQSVTVHGREDIKGVISTLPPHVSKDKDKVAKVTELSVDIGYNKEQAQKLVAPGDSITINSCFRELADTRISSPALDDRSGVCTVLAALDMIKERELKYNIAVCFAVREEIGCLGAKTAAFQIKPDRALAVDVSFGNTPDGKDYDTAKLGSGVMIGISPSLDRRMSLELCDTAKRCDIPFTREVMPGDTGTDADNISESGGGVRCCTLSFPIRYMHTPNEVLDIKDVEAAARLICEYVCKG